MICSHCRKPIDLEEGAIIEWLSNDIEALSETIRASHRDCEYSQTNDSIWGQYCSPAGGRMKETNTKRMIGYITGFCDNKKTIQVSATEIEHEGEMIETNPKYHVHTLKANKTLRDRAIHHRHLGLKSIIGYDKKNEVLNIWECEE